MFGGGPAVIRRASGPEFGGYVDLTRLQEKEGRIRVCAFLLFGLCFTLQRLMDFFTFKAVRVILRKHQEAQEQEQQLLQSKDRDQASTRGEPSPLYAALKGMRSDDDEEDGLLYTHTKECQDAEWLQS